MLKRASGSLERLDTLARSAEQGLGEVNAIAGSIRRGEGSLGKLVQDDDDLPRPGRTLAPRRADPHGAGGEPRRPQADLAVVAVFRPHGPTSTASGCSSSPGSQRNSRSFRADELFEPGRSVLTPIGRARLDEVARWCKLASRPGIEVVIAAFTDDDRDEDLAEILTQEQADAVRNYLVDEALDPVGRLVQASQDRLRRLRHPCSSDPRRHGRRTTAVAPRGDHPVYTPDLSGESSRQGLASSGRGRFNLSGGSLPVGADDTVLARRGRSRVIDTSGRLTLQPAVRQVPDHLGDPLMIEYGRYPARANEQAHPVPHRHRVGMFHFERLAPELLHRPRKAAGVGASR